MIQQGGGGGPAAGPVRRGRGSAIVPPFPRTAQVFLEGYQHYERRFNLRFPERTVTESNGLPRNAIQVFGPNAYPAMYALGGSNFTKLQKSFPEFYINVYRLNWREEASNDQLQLIIWVERCSQQEADGVEAREAGLINGLRRFSQFRVRISQQSQPQLMLLDEYFEKHVEDFEAVVDDDVESGGMRSVGDFQTQFGDNYPLSTVYHNSQQEPLSTEYHNSHPAPLAPEYYGSRPETLYPEHYDSIPEHYDSVPEHYESHKAPAFQAPEQDGRGESFSLSRSPYHNFMFRAPEQDGRGEPFSLDRSQYEHFIGSRESYRNDEWERGRQRGQVHRPSSARNGRPRAANAGGYATVRRAVNDDRSRSPAMERGGRRRSRVPLAPQSQQFKRSGHFRYPAYDEGYHHGSNSESSWAQDYLY